MFTAQYMNFDEKSRLYPEKGPGKPFPVTTPLERALLIIVAIVVVIGIALSISIVSIKRANDKYEMRLIVKLKNETNTCYSPACITEASHLLKSMNMSVNPCTDFYSFVCGNWIKNAYLVTTLESQFTKLTRHIILRVKGILEDLEKEENLPENKKKTKDFYKFCMDKVHRNTMGAKDLISDLKKFGGWPLIEENWMASHFNWSKLVVELFKNGYIYNMLFTFAVDADTKNTSRSLIEISQPSLGLKNRFFYTFDGELVPSYKHAILKLAQHLYLEGNLQKDKAVDAIEEAFKLEKRIANLTKEIDRKNPDTFYNILTLRELELFAPKIPWRYLLENILPPDTELTDEEPIMITVPSMIKGLNNILDEMDNDHGKQILANYMLYRVVVYAANQLSRQFYSFVDYVFNADRTGPSQLWEVCVRTTMELFPLPLTSSYAKKYMDHSTKELLEEMVKDIKYALIKNIKSAVFLDYKTKSYALYKVKKMRAAIAYQDEIMEDENLDSYYKDINITDDHFNNVKQLTAFRLRQSMEGLHKKRTRFRWTDVDNLLTANAYYEPGQNAIIIPVGVLQDEVFAAGRPNYINYGSLGMIVGHELTHAFDSIGSLYDADGSFKTWWTKYSWSRYERRVKCFEEQYSKYYMPLANAYVNGTLTLAENIADNGGLQTAYYAYNSMLKRKGSEKSLPGVHFNDRQMFWISFASVWCRKQTEDSIQYSIKHSAHTPSRFRVIGSLSNMKEFSEDFNCKINTPMHPSSRCFLWK